MVSPETEALAAVADPYKKEGFLEMQVKGKMMRMTSWATRKLELDPEARTLTYLADGKKKGMTSLVDSTVTKVANAHKRYCFVVQVSKVSKGEDDTLTLAAHDDADRDDWMTAIGCAAKWDDVQAARKAIVDEERQAKESADEAKRAEAKARKEAAVKRAQEVREKALAASKLVKEKAAPAVALDSGAVLASAINNVALDKMQAGAAETVDTVVTETRETRVTRDGETSVTTAGATEASVTLRAEVDAEGMESGVKRSVEEARAREIRIRQEAAEKERLDEEKRQARAAKIAAYREEQEATAEKEAAAHSDLADATLTHEGPIKKGAYNTTQNQKRDLISLGDKAGGAAMTLEEKMAAIRKAKGKDSRRQVVTPIKDPYPEADGWL